jgi:hypothetical protein
MVDGLLSVTLKCSSRLLDPICYFLSNSRIAADSEGGEICLALSRLTSISPVFDEKSQVVLLDDPLFGHRELRFDTPGDAQLWCFVLRAASVHSGCHCLRDFRTITSLGHDRLGSTSLVEDLTEGGVYALREIPIHQLQRSTEIVPYLTAMALPQHPFIVGVSRSFVEGESLYVCLRYPLGGSFAGAVELSKGHLRLAAAEVPRGLPPPKGPGRRPG